jgi:hypothetical protein
MKTSRIVAVDTANVLTVLVKWRTLSGAWIAAIRRHQIGKSRYLSGIGVDRTLNH